MKRVLICLLAGLMFPLVGCGQTTTLPPESPVHAYFLAIELLYGNNTDRTEDVDYLAFDFSELALEDKVALVELVQAFCEEEGFTFLEGTIDELMEAGYITQIDLGNGNIVAGGFYDGVLFEIETLSTTESEIVAEISMWRSPVGATGSTVTLTFQEGQWVALFGDYWLS